MYCTVDKRSLCFVTRYTEICAQHLDWGFPFICLVPPWRAAAVRQHFTHGLLSKIMCVGGPSTLGVCINLVLVSTVTAVGTLPLQYTQGRIFASCKEEAGKVIQSIYKPCESQHPLMLWSVHAWWQAFGWLKFSSVSPSFFFQPLHV